MTRKKGPGPSCLFVLAGRGQRRVSAWACPHRVIPAALVFRRIRRSLIRFVGRFLLLLGAPFLAGTNGNSVRTSAAVSCESRPGKGLTMGLATVGAQDSVSPLPCLGGGLLAGLFVGGKGGGEGWARLVFAPALLGVLRDRIEDARATSALLGHGGP